MRKIINFFYNNIKNITKEIKMESEIARKAYREIYDYKNILKNQDIIINEKDAKYAFHLLDNIIFKNRMHLKNAKINELVRIVETNSFYFGMLYPRYKIGNIKRAESIVISTKNPAQIFSFAKEIKECNTNLLFETLLDIKDLYYIKRYISEIEFDKNNYSVCYFI